MLRILAMQFTLLTFALIIGCNSSREVTATVVTPETAEIAWHEQIQQVLDGHSDRIEISSTVIQDEQLSELMELNTLRVLILDAGQITDKGAEILAKLPSLSQLRLRDSPLSDTGLKGLAQSPSLELINLPQAACSAEGIRSLAQLRNLKQLRIASAALTGPETANALCELTSLRSLHLIQVPLEDADLQTLASLKQLNSLYVDGSLVSDAGWEAFFRARPDVHVHVDQKHKDFDPRQD